MRTSFYKMASRSVFSKIAIGISCCLFLIVSSISGQYYFEDFENQMPENWFSSGHLTVKQRVSFSDYWLSPAPSDYNYMAGINHPRNNFDGEYTLMSDEIDLVQAPGNLVLKMRSNFLSLSGKSTARILISEDGGDEWKELHEVKSQGYWSDLAIRFDYGGKKIRLLFEYKENEKFGQGWLFDNISIDDFESINDVEIIGWNEEPLFKGGLEGAKIFPGVVIKNNGSDIVTSIDFSYSANGKVYHETFQNLNIDPLESMLIETKTPYILGADSVQINNARITNVNGNGLDDNPGNDELVDPYTIITVVPHPDKGVLVEETGGTWCLWSPRGYLYMDGMSRRYPDHFVGVSIHNDDDMMVDEYDGKLRRRVNEWPTVFVERRLKFDPKKIETPFMDAVTQAPVAKLELGGEFDSETRELNISLKAKFLIKPLEEYKLGAIIVEDGVTGQQENFELGHQQLNAYAGGEYGPMGGYELLPSLVPSTLKTYEGVARALVGGFDGEEDSLPYKIEAGEVFVHNFASISIADEVDLENVRIIGVIYGEKGLYTGEYPYPDNAIVSTFSELTQSGVFEQIDRSANSEINVSIDPNPMHDLAQIKINTSSEKNSSLEIYDVQGRLIAERQFGIISGANQFEYDSGDIPSGTYIFKFLIGTQKIAKKVVVVKD